MLVMEEGTRLKSYSQGISSKRKWETQTSHTDGPCVVFILHYPFIATCDGEFYASNLTCATRCPNIWSNILMLA